MIVPGKVLSSAPRHVAVSGRVPMFRYERCHEGDCVVNPYGVATCGSVACPACGSGGVNLKSRPVTVGGGEEATIQIECTCGHVWQSRAYAAAVANLRPEMAELGSGRMSAQAR